MISIRCMFKNRILCLSKVFMAGLTTFVVFYFTGCSILAEKPIRLDIKAQTYPRKNHPTVKRVLLFPFSNETEFKNQTEVVEKAFAQVLSERNCFEVVIPPPEDVENFDDLQPFTTGRFPFDVLIELGECYSVDAVFLACLKMYNPYTPPLIGLKADLISVHNGTVLRSLHGLLDARDESVARDVAHYFENHCAQNDSIFEWRIIMASPQLYARYACTRFVDTLYPKKSPVKNQEPGSSQIVP